MQKITSYKQAINFIYAQIPTKEKLFSGDIGLTRTKYFLKQLGDPQNDFKSIHIAGTSGKGSTAIIISKLLQANGYTTGLTLSPHLIDIRERVQIDNELISKKQFVGILNDIMPTIKSVEKSKYGHPTYFELIIAIYFIACKLNNVDYAIIETGLGGRIDGTNVITRSDKISVITKIGKDHTHILGKYLYQIAAEKAGIINKDSHTFLMDQPQTILNTINKISKKRNSTLHVIKTTNIKNIVIENGMMSFDLKKQIFNFSQINTSLIGTHQSENITFALNIIDFITKRDNLTIDKTLTTTALKNLTFPGRLESIKYKNQQIFIDGAHNPQKMKALVNSLKLITNEKFDVVLAIKAGKDYKKMVSILIPITNKFILTTFTINQENTGIYTNPTLIEKYIKKNFKIEVSIELNPLLAITKLVTSNNPKLITGSLYLLSQIKSNL